MFKESLDHFAQALQQTPDNKFTLRNFADATLFYNKKNLDIGKLISLLFI
jgi:hypothetical protein